MARQAIGVAVLIHLDKEDQGGLVALLVPDGHNDLDVTKAADELHRTKSDKCSHPILGTPVTQILHMSDEACLDEDLPVETPLESRREIAHNERFIKVCTVVDKLLSRNAHYLDRGRLPSPMVVSLIPNVSHSIDRVAHVFEIHVDIVSSSTISRVDRFETTQMGDLLTALVVSNQAVEPDPMNNIVVSNPQSGSRARMCKIKWRKRTYMSIWPAVHEQGFMMPAHEDKAGQDLASIVLSEDISTISPRVEVNFRFRTLDEARGRVIGG